MDIACAYLTRAATQSIHSLNMAIQNVLTDVRDDFINDDRSCTKAVVLIGVEVGLLLNIPIAIIEIIFRTALAILTYPCRTKNIENVTWVGAIISATYLINNILALIRGLNFNKKINNNHQIVEWLPCLFDLNLWAQSSVAEYDRDPRRTTIPR